MDIGKVIKAKREALKMTQDELARRIDVSPATISLYESGARKPEIENIRKLSIALGTTEVELLNIRVPKTNIDLALRAQEDLNDEDIKQIKSFIDSIKYARQSKRKNK